MSDAAERAAELRAAGLAALAGAAALEITAGLEAARAELDAGAAVAIAAARAAAETLVMEQAALAALEAELGECRRRQESARAAERDPDLAVRVEARALKYGFTEEIVDLEAQRAAQGDAVAGAARAWGEAEKHAALMIGGIRELTGGIADPLGDPGIRELAEWRLPFYRSGLWCGVLMTATDEKADPDARYPDIDLAGKAYGMLRYLARVTGLERELQLEGMAEMQGNPPDFRDRGTGAPLPGHDRKILARIDPLREAGAVGLSAGAQANTAAPGLMPPVLASPDGYGGSL